MCNSYAEFNRRHSNKSKSGDKGVVRKWEQTWKSKQTVRRVNQTKIIYRMQKNRKQCKGQNTLITIFYAQLSVNIAFIVQEPGSELNLETVQHLGDGSLWQSGGGGVCGWGLI